MREIVFIGSILTIIFSFIFELIFGLFGTKSWTLSLLLGFLSAGIYVGYNIGGNILKYGAISGLFAGIIGCIFFELISIILYWMKYGSISSASSLIMFFIGNILVYGIATFIGSIIGVIIKWKKSPPTNINLINLCL